MTGADWTLIGVACAGIALAIVLIARVRLHPFVGLLTAALAVGLAVGAEPQAVVASIEKGFGDILKGTGIVVALGLALGTMLQVSGGAQALAARALAATGHRRAAWGAMLAAFVLGLPLFFETGVVLLLPIIAAGLPVRENDGGERLKVMLCALAALSVLHALLPPHPGPLIAVGELGAPLARTMLLGLVAAVPTVLVAGPLLARFTAPRVRVAETGIAGAEPLGTSGAGAALALLLFPVALIALGGFARLDKAGAHGWLTLVSDPPVALLLAVLAGMVVLFGRRLAAREIQDAVWGHALLPAAGILLSIGAGGALKQVLVDAGLSQIFVKLAAAGTLSPLLMAWLVAVAVRLATGSATVATITTSGIMAGVAHAAGADPALLVLAIGAGSVFFSHVNDPGFWLVKGYLGTSTADTFRTWSVLETAISVTGLASVLALSLIT